MKRSRSGERLWRDIRVRVVIPGQDDIIWRNRCEARHGWTEAQLDKMLDQVAEHLEQRFPTIDFRVVELAPNSFNFIYAGRKDNMPEKLSVCPAAAQSSAIAEHVCSVQGHSIGSYDGGQQVGPQGPVQVMIQFCPKCGMTLSEVRDQIETTLRTHIGNEVNKRMGVIAAAAKQQAESPAPPAGEPDKKIADLGAGAVLTCAVCGKPENACICVKNLDLPVVGRAAS